MVRSVKLRGSFRGAGGYDQQVREFARELSLRGVGVHLEETQGWDVVLPLDEREPPSEVPRAAKAARTTLHFCMPNQLDLDPGRFNVNYTMYEATGIPPAWVESHRAHDLIVLPTEHSRSAWVGSGVPESKLRVCPLGVRTDLYRTGLPPLPLRDADCRNVESRAVRFLNVSTMIPRKNLAGLVRAWIRATRPDDDAVLIMKLSHLEGRHRFESQLKAVQKELGRKLAQAAPLYLIYDILQETDMPRLFASATHYVSLSNGEGWDLCMTQAAAAGLRLIAPRHSAYLSYLDEDVAALISAREAPAVLPDGTGSGVWFRDANWWVPDQDEAVARLRDAIDGKDEPKASAAQEIRERFGWQEATTRLIEILDELETGEPRGSGAFAGP